MHEKLKVFISSVIRKDELAQERAVVCDAADTEYTKPICFDKPGLPEPIPPDDWSSSIVRKCDIFVQLLDKSLTTPVANEYEAAKNANKPRIVFLKQDRQRDSELLEHIAHIKDEVTCGKFTNTHDLRDRFQMTLVGAVLALASNQGKSSENLTECLKRGHALATKPYSVLSFEPWTSLDTTQNLVEVFEDGILEATKTISAEIRQERVLGGYEPELVAQLPQYVSLLADRGVKPPIYLTLCFQNTKGCTMWLDPLKWSLEAFRMNRIASNELTPKAKILRHLSDLGTPEQAAHFLKRQLDDVWRAAGKHGSFYFDENGNWRGAT